MVYHSGNTYYSSVVHGAEKLISGKGFNAILCNTEGSQKKEDEHIKRLSDSVDGFIISPVLHDGIYGEGIRSLIRKGTPVVLVCEAALNSELNYKLDYVVPDDCTGGFLAVKHLLECGYRDIKIMYNQTSVQSFSINERLRGARFALAEKGIPFNEKMIVRTTAEDPFNAYEKDGYMAAKKIISLRGKPVGIFAMGDYLAIGLMRGLKELGAGIPEEFGICGFDDIDLARQWGVELTTVAQKREETGETASRLLFERISKPADGERHILMPVELIKRKTTAILHENSISYEKDKKQ